MFSKALDSRNQEEQPCQPSRQGGKNPTLLRNPFAGSLKFEALQLQTGSLGGRVGGTMSSSGAWGSWEQGQQGSSCTEQQWWICHLPDLGSSLACGPELAANYSASLTLGFTYL